MSENYISRQISVYKTDKKLIEFNDKLNMAPIETYAHIHAQGEECGDGRKIYSNIGVVLQDYTGRMGEQMAKSSTSPVGKVDKTVRVEANISPDEALYIFSHIQSHCDKFEFKQEKIWSDADDKGLSTVKKIKVLRANIGTDGKPRNYPWYIEVENGTGIASKTKTGGTFCKANSYKCNLKVFINLNDADFFKVMNRVSQYILGWELAVAPSLIKRGRTAIMVNMQENNA